jgi:hypothetical protein
MSFEKNVNLKIKIEIKNNLLKNRKLCKIFDARGTILRRKN